jgi:hypothetical protein
MALARSVGENSIKAPFLGLSAGLNYRIVTCSAASPVPQEAYCPVPTRCSTNISQFDVHLCEPSLQFEKQMQERMKINTKETDFKQRFLSAQ